MDYLSGPKPEEIIKYLSRENEALKEKLETVREFKKKLRMGMEECESDLHVILKSDNLNTEDRIAIMKVVDKLNML